MPKSPIFSQIQPHPEPSSLVAFSANDLDSRAEHRGEDCIAEALKTDGAHVLAFAGNRLVLKHENQLLDPLFAPYELEDLRPDLDNAVLLGFRPNGEPRLAVPVGIDPEIEHDHLKFADGRTLMRQALVTDQLLGEYAAASSLMSWHRASRFCGQCGTPTESEIGGFRRRCPACNAQSFPRTDPVVIMLAIDEERDCCLLGRSPHFPEGMVSCLAGFLEPGETIENAVRRETREESGIRIGRVRYAASQPWPMPHSLMIGCYGEALSRTIRRDTAELEDCDWFSRQDVRDMIEGTHPDGRIIPVSGAIAYRLILDWLDWPANQG